MSDSHSTSVSSIDMNDNNEDSKEFYQTFQYEVPEWASHLRNIPSKYVKLSNLNTPIHKWNLPDLPEGVTIHIKRDDLTGAELTGNKVRYLQIMFGEALQAGCKHIVTSGVPDSGQCRAMSLACRLLGLIPHVVVVASNKEEVGSKANALLYRMAGAQIYLTPLVDFDSFRAKLYKLSDYISTKYQEKCYAFTVGGSSVKGVFGFISLFQEMLDQGLHERFDDIVLPIATCPTSAGLAVANYLTGSKVKIHSVLVGLPTKVLVRNIDGILKELGLDNIKVEDILDIMDEYFGEKQGTATDEVLDFITHVSSTTGILLDPTFTSKAAFGMLAELEKNPARFKGKRILFIHTGGMFGLFNGEMDRVVNKEGSITNQFMDWPDADIPPWECMK